MLFLATILDATWTPESVLIVVCAGSYVAGQVSVMIIRALKGNNTQTSLEAQVSALTSRVIANESRIVTVAQAQTPPAVVGAMVKEAVRTTAFPLVPAGLVGTPPEAPDA